MTAEVLWPLFHYIPLSMLESDTEMIHQVLGKFPLMMTPLVALLMVDRCHCRAACTARLVFLRNSDGTPTRI